MAQFEPLRTELDRLAASLVYVAAEKTAGWWKPVKYFREDPISFPFLLDEDRSVTKTYGLYHGLAHDAFRIAHPATLVVDGHNVIRYIYRGENQTDRAPVQELLAALRKLSRVDSVKRPS